MRIEEVLRLLQAEYGQREWTPDRDPISTLIATVLSQNTSDANSNRAFKSLRSAFDTWDAVADAGTHEIAGAIRLGGLAEVKAKRIRLILEKIRVERGALDLSFLEAMPLDEARAWLRQLPGVGPKTAGCVLLFSLGMPALPVDTHVLRVARRLGLIGPGVNAERAHELLEAMVPPAQVYSFHLDMIEHGRRVCKAQRPRCHLCVLQEPCPGDVHKQVDARRPAAKHAGFA